ncbi:MAG: polyphenol oxidase family protein [Spirochaetaceae bacterium]|jgi:YfiH family protein|nr:polyphenol oxidase family protein [Spirochaetaceae bacterium]
MANQEDREARLYPFHLAFNKDNLAWFPFMMDGAAVSPAGKAIGCGISSRAAGSMSLRDPQGRANRRRLYAALGREEARFFTCMQVHSRKALVLGPESPAEGPEADGMISQDREACLLITVADCLPVYLYDTQSGAFALVHSGWKGTGIALTALKLMNEGWSTRPKAVAAVLGPCIGPCCYAVEPTRSRNFEAEFGGETGAFPLGSVVKENALDLQAANARLLVNAGVRHIAVCKDCTCTDERLGSFRREGVAYTAMAAWAGYF